MSTSVVGATTEDVEDDDDEGSVHSENDVAAPTELCYQVVGTMSDKSKQKPAWVKEVYEVKFYFSHAKIESLYLRFDTAANNGLNFIIYFEVISESLELFCINKCLRYSMWQGSKHLISNLIYVSFLLVWK